VVAEEAGLLVIDVSDPAAPHQVGHIDTLGRAYGVHVAGTHAYVAAADAGLQVIDVSDPAAPHQVGGVDTPGWAYDVHVTGTHAYVADWEAGLLVVHVQSVEPASVIHLPAVMRPAES
jgi:hypothetical protein